MLIRIYGGSKMTAKIDGTKYLEQVKEKLKNRMDELNRQIAEGQKDIEKHA